MGIKLNQSIKLTFLDWPEASLPVQVRRLPSWTGGKSSGPVFPTIFDRMVAELAIRPWLRVDGADDGSLCSPDLGLLRGVRGGDQLLAVRTAVIQVSVFSLPVCLAFIYHIRHRLPWALRDRFEAVCCPDSDLNFFLRFRYCIPEDLAQFADVVNTVLKGIPV